MKYQRWAGEFSTNGSFDLNTPVPDNTNQDTGSFSQTAQDSSLSESSSRNAILNISDDVIRGEPELSHDPFLSPRSWENSRMARQTGNPSDPRQVDNNPLDNNNSVPLNANSQGFVPSYHPGTYFYEERLRGYFYPSLEGGQNTVQFSAHETMNGPYEFHNHQYIHPTWFNGSPLEPQVPTAEHFGSFHQWPPAFPEAYQPNNFAVNQQIPSDHFPWFPFDQDGPVSYAQYIDLPCIHNTIYGYLVEIMRIPNPYFPGPSISQYTHHPDGLGVQQTSQAMQVPTNREDWVTPEFDDYVYADDGIHSHHPESVFRHIMRFLHQKLERNP